jgi:hypothetical protein
MKIALSGLCFEIGPDAQLAAEERRRLDRWPSASGAPCFQLTVSDGPRAPVGRMGMPASVEVVDRRILVRHAAFAAVLDAAAGSGQLRREVGPAFPLEITLRTALAALLPLHGGVPLHATGIVIERAGIAFFGPSGAGKSTLAAASPHPVLSDELVSIVGDEPYSLAAPGFWGSLDRDGADPRRAPLVALVELGKGPELVWERLTPEQALRRLLHVTLVPPDAALWTAALQVLARLVRTVPVYRMRWNLSSPPWAEIARRIGTVVRR